jgi:hypothetical protein
MTQKLKTGRSSKSSPIREILAGRYEPVNNQARHGLLGAKFSRLPLPDEPLPKGGIDCSRWDKDKIEGFFKKRYPWISSKTLGQLTGVACRMGRIR